MKKNITCLSVLWIALFLVNCQKSNPPCMQTLITQSNCSTPFIDPRDGQSYCTVTIGNQIWMSENMRYDTPDTIVNGKDDTPNQCNTVVEILWSTTNTFSDYQPIYGRYYTWEAAQHVCPSGWHLPSDSEWQILESYLGMSNSDTSGLYWRGTTEAASLKSTQYWTNYQLTSGQQGVPQGNGTNSTGFNAYPSGFLGYSSNTELQMSYLGTGSFYWTSNSYYHRFLSYSTQEISRINANSYPLYSCRCVKN